MPPWDSYPPTYRTNEIKAILNALCAGECVALVGLSGSGKSNLLGFLAHRISEGAPPWALVDCNRMTQATPAAFYGLVRRALGEPDAAESGLEVLETAIEARLAANAGKLCLLFDRFDALPDAIVPSIGGNLRSLRDEHKYDLTYVIASRRPPDARSELAELFFAHTLWLGPLSAQDGRWSAASYARRRGLEWDAATLDGILRLSGGYPAWLRAVCEAVADGAPLDPAELCRHPAVKLRLAEFWADEPTLEMLALSRLQGVPLLDDRPARRSAAHEPDLTAKELLLLDYFRAHPARVCEKDELIRAVWPEDRIFLKGVRDDSLAQLVRRLREKIEEDPSSPKRIQTIPGRGYRYLEK